MPAVASEQAYQDLINALDNFMREVSAQCDLMEKAATDCVDNYNDPASAKAQTKLNEHIKNIKDEFETVEEIKKFLNEQMERIKEKNKGAEGKIDQL